MCRADDGQFYVCLECGCVFQNPKEYTERHGLDTPPYEHFSGCPSCGSAYVPAIFCDNCGEAIRGDYVKVKNGEVFCDECYTVRDVWDSTV